MTWYTRNKAQAAGPFKPTKIRKPENEQTTQLSQLPARQVGGPNGTVAGYPVQPEENPGVPSH